MTKQVHLDTEQGRRSRSGRSGERRTNVHAESRNKRARSWNSHWAAAAQAVKARGAVASSAYIALAWLLQSQAAIATGGGGMPQNRARSDLRGPEIQNFPGGAAPRHP